MITKRDQDIYNYLEDFHIATSKQLHRLFFSNTSERYSRKRLQYLTETGFIKQTKSTIDNCFAYYIKKPVQIHHDLIRSELFVSMNEKYKILSWHNEMTVENIRPDAMAFIDDHGIEFPVFIEVHLSNKFDFDKYENLIKKTDLRALFGIMPRVVICTDRHVTVPKINLKFVIVGIDMQGLDSLFKRGIY